MIVALRCHTLLPLDDCLHGRQSSIPHLVRSSLHPAASPGDEPLARTRGRQTEEESVRRPGDRLLPRRPRRDPNRVRPVPSDSSRSTGRRSWCLPAFNTRGTRAAADVLRALVGAVPCRFRAALTENDLRFCRAPRDRSGPTARIQHASVRLRMSRKRHRASPHEAQPSLDRWAGRADEPGARGSDRQALSARKPRAARAAPAAIRRRLRRRTPPEDPARARIPRMRLPNVDEKAGSVQEQTVMPFRDHTVAACPSSRRGVKGPGARGGSSAPPSEAHAIRRRSSGRRCGLSGCRRRGAA